MHEGKAKWVSRSGPHNFPRFWKRLCYLAAMPYRPKKARKTEPKTGELENHLFRSNQVSEQRRRDLATRSTLSRLRNRKSDLK